MASGATSPHPGGTLLGRAVELADLADRLDLAGARPPGTVRAVLVAGEAGMGKTRLLAELSDRAAVAGWRVMVGHCLDLADLMIPYLPFSELVGRLADDDPDTAREIVRLHPALAALAPGRRLMSGSDGGRVDRADIFEDVHAALEALAVDGPVLVVVEDLHWADQSTRDLLSFLFARPFRGRVGLVGSYRSDDLHRRHPLRGAVAEWGRLPGVSRMQLGPLADADVRRLVRSLQQGRLPERDVAWVVARAEGNAFFAEELVGASQLGAGPGVLPENLADLLLVRVDRLDDAARLVVRAAACAGRRVTHSLLAAVVELSADELEHALRVAVDSNVLVQVGSDSYSFRHALLSEAVYDDLLPGERVRLHGKYAGALAAGVVDATAAELATHARAAHDPDAAIRAGLQAGNEAMAVGGPDDAAKHFAAALDLLGRGSPSVRADIDLGSLVDRASEALVASGHSDRAMRLVRSHLDDPQEPLSSEDRARLLLTWAAAALVSETTDEERLDATGAAMELAGKESSRLRTRALSLHSRALVSAGRDDEAATYAGEALAMAQGFGMTRVATEAATTLATLDDRSGDAEGAIRALQVVVESARQAGDTTAEMRGRYHLAFVHLERGRLSEAQELFGQAAAVAASVGRPWAPYGFDARYHHAMTALLRGQWQEALEVADPAGESPPADQEALLLTVRMLVAAGRGDDSMLGHYDALRSSWPREPLIAVNSGAAAVDLLGQRGDLDGMWRVHDEVVDGVGRVWSPLFQARLRLSALVLGQLGNAASRSPAEQRSSLADRAAGLSEVVTSVVRDATARTRGMGPEGQAWATRARAEALRLGWLTGDDVPAEDELVAVWTDTVRLFDDMSHRYESARSRTRLAAVLRAAGRPGEAAPLLTAAREVAEALGARPLTDEVDSLGSARRTTTRSAGAATTELTPREHEILALVAQGRTNGEVARQLFISTKTVSVHVSNILAKLRAGGRTEAVAIARRRGVLVD